ncbi:DUF433 domain-containing protein [Pseudomonas abyssi]|uniref:DUF433 domain-containing protein n=1 Tax=Pseudomonas abyssi TaxID=170540 RepID=A0A2A3MFX9_9PSED|nr:DUF433 domain-containing protein [Pseudomonadales bacterium]PBK03545.1 DUF433 domain-containing protein [Pseudomonas abyssi]|tara:strand:+ start:1157 stop:1849 length:693 start_codon:yes stop_codon:yes gene_type:complete
MKDSDTISSLLGIGLYSLPEAATYTDIPVDQINRWVFGYRAAGKLHSGLWQPALAGLEEKTLSFHDLLEIRFVHAFRQYNVSLQAIRAAAAHAREWFDQPYPFTCRRFQTDGRTIFASVMEETGDEALIDLVKRQYAFKQVISDSLYAGIDYDREGEALRWYPLKSNKSVVLDPARHFGKPILAKSGIDTETVAAAYQAEGQSIRRVASIYELTAAEVEAALKFERKDAA